MPQLLRNSILSVSPYHSSQRPSASIHPDTETHANESQSCKGQAIIGPQVALGCSTVQRIPLHGSQSAKLGSTVLAPALLSVLNLECILLLPPSSLLPLLSNNIFTSPIVARRFDLLAAYQIRSILPLRLQNALAQLSHEYLANETIWIAGCFVEVNQNPEESITETVGKGIESCTCATVEHS